MSSAYLSLGSNLGDREEYLRDALQQLDGPHIRIVRRSSIYETEPRDLPDQPWFLNLVVEIETALAPADLLARIQAIESTLGRERIVPKGPRTVDIDILSYDDRVIASADLEIPHPRLTERRFVLEPLAEIAPSFRHPVSGQAIADLLSATTSQFVKKR